MNLEYLLSIWNNDYIYKNLEFAKLYNKKLSTHIIADDLITKILETYNIKIIL